MRDFVPEATQATANTVWIIEHDALIILNCGLNVNCFRLKYFAFCSCCYASIYLGGLHISGCSILLSTIL